MTLLVIKYLDRISKGSQINFIYLIIFSISLYLLRPFTLYTIIAIYFFLYHISGSNRSFKTQIYSLIIIIVIISFFWNPISNKLNSYIYNFNYHSQYTLEDRSAKSGFSDYYFSNNLVKTYSFAALRFLITPLPHSLFSRLINDGGTKYGTYSEILRFIHQLVYFYILGYLIYNIKHILPTITNFSSKQKLLLYSYLAYLPIYSFYNLGGVHQRTKVPFQIAVILIFLFIKKMILMMIYFCLFLFQLKKFFQLLIKLKLRLKILRIGLFMLFLLLFLLHFFLLF